jgi:hypothetical protein
MPSDSGWVQHSHLFADDGSSKDWFGTSVAISGDTVVVGAFQDNLSDSQNDAGSAYVFIRAGDSMWSQQDHLVADDAAANDSFGWSVAIDGDTIVVGAWEDNTVAGFDAGSA